MTGLRFDQAGYWVKRHQNFKNDPRSVGNLASTIEENIKGEAELKTAVAHVARKLAERHSTVLDLGCGYGRIASEFIGNGLSYSGIDISEEAIRRARAGVPKGKFFQGNLVEWTTRDQFDVVCVLYVFVHFVEDSQWLAVLEAALSRLTPRGVLFFADHFPVERLASVPHVVCRPLRDYEAVFSRHGFQFDADLARCAVEAVAGNPHAKQFRFARRQ